MKWWMKVLCIVTIRLVFWGTFIYYLAVWRNHINDAAFSFTLLLLLLEAAVFGYHGVADILEIYRRRNMLSGEQNVLFI